MGGETNTRNGTDGDRVAWFYAWVGEGQRESIPPKPMKLT